jgi:hypothetical protein
MPRHFSMPKIEFESVEDYYTFYVLILGVPEEVFWHFPYKSLMKIADNYTAYKSWEKWIEYERMQKK